MQNKIGYREEQRVEANNRDPVFCVVQG